MTLIHTYLQISKLLVVDPTKRLTATQALEHAFFKREEVSGVSATPHVHASRANSFKGPKPKVRVIFPQNCNMIEVFVKRRFWSKVTFCIIYNSRNIYEYVIVNYAKFLTILLAVHKSKIYHTLVYTSI